jgi:hypothetical protein
MNPQLLIPVGMFLVSELLPFLPCKQNSVLQIAVRGLNVAKIVPDDAYKNFLKAAQNGTANVTDEPIAKPEPIHKMEHHVQISLVVDKPKDE